jgi:uncharacterized membrane protein YfcA
MELAWSLIAALGAVGLLAGFVDSLAGGGGLLTLPALLLAGFDPVSALATNKLQSTFGSGSAALAFARRGHIDVRSARRMMATTLAGSWLGVAAVRVAPLSLLSVVLPLLLIAMALYFAFSSRFSPKAGIADGKARLSPGAFALTAAPLIGFYDGLFGPGTGSFFMLTFVALCGYGVIHATANTKILNFTSNFAALLVFIVSAKIVWLVGLAMGVGEFLGAQAGSYMAARQGARLIRPLLVMVCCAVAVKLLLDPANPLHQAVMAWIGQ